MSYLKVESVGRNFGDFVALSDISFELQRGEIVTLLGPSGCGKTTLLRAIAGLEAIDRGTITLDGRELANGQKGMTLAPERRGIGMVFQSYALWPHMTVGENIALGLKLKKVDKATMKRRIASALEMVGLPGAENRATSSMSGGQQQRVSLARALALEPACILFDEPLSNLDVLLRDRMRFEIRELLKKAGITAIYVTHDQSEAMVISDRVLIMNKGKLLQSGSPTELYTHPRSRFVAEFFGRTNLFAVDHARSRPGLVKTQDGLEFVCRPDLTVSRGALMGFRPEAMEIASDGNACNVLSTRTDRAVYLGGVTQVDGKVGNIPVTAMLGGLHTMRADATLHLRVAPENIMILEGEQ
ncbi:hypothetical protein CIC12_20085 [Burkholderia sp. SG-MS1]|uniref:ABC transporter ATP-binding protein n=1 Tax=Paraburkholderia sp. SG-MS1 TaxID=2023741 RepID=UPI001444ADDC|nr:ABC transporter ATP-binding protein [Paraburkholderia sp. SG-MS1]NKJ48995.1 hypothetical protein [Paraburkholderia sp. SG-MS1]